MTTAKEAVNALDKYDIGSAIDSAFTTKALIMYIENYDDEGTFGWEVAPLPGTVIQVQVPYNREMHIRITKYVTFIGYGEPTCKKSVLFNGVIPANANHEPDIDFVAKILRNWGSIGI